MELVDAFQGFIADHPALTAELVSRLRSQLRLLEASATAMTWLDRWLDDEGHGAEESAARATQRLALTQVMMANSITSLRTLGGMDWPEFVEAQSVLEAALRRDPAGTYSRMTFETRDQYRHVVERLARRTGRPEEQVAAIAVDLARRPPQDPSTASSHVGFFLLGAGQVTLEQSVGYRPPLGERLLQAARRDPDLALAGQRDARHRRGADGTPLDGRRRSAPSWLLLTLLALLPANHHFPDNAGSPERVELIEPVQAGEVDEGKLQAQEAAAYPQHARAFLQRTLHARHVADAESDRDDRIGHRDMELRDRPVRRRRARSARRERLTSSMSLLISHTVT